MTRPRRGGLRADEAGSYLVLYALMIAGVLTMMAIVIDIGAVRNDRRKDRNAADAAASAGTLDLALSSRTACTTAWRFALRNLGFTPTTDPCATVPTECEATRTTPLATGSVSGYAIRIFHPVQNDSALMLAEKPGGDIAQSYPAGEGVPCERLGVEIRYTRASLWGGIVGNRQNTTTVHSVARLSPDGPEEDPASLVLLERHECRAARVQGSNSKIVVTSAGVDSPGIIQADSRGDGACPGNAKILQGGPDQAIKAEHARDAFGTVTKTARIGIYAKLFGAANAHSPWPTEIGEPDPIGFKQIGRTPVDVRYLESARSLETDATAMVTRSTLPPGFVDATGPAPGLNLGCTIDTPTPITAAQGTRLWFNCPGGLTVKNLTIDSPNAEVVINGDLNIVSPGFVIRDARKVWMRGKSSSNKRGLDVGGPFSVNAGNSPNCTARFAADRTKTATVFVKEGSFLVSGANLRLCQTTVYLRGDDSATAASLLPPAVTPPPALPPAPANNSSLGSIDVGSGSATDWTAPNQLDVRPTPADLAIYPFEDLALWTEASASSPLNGGGGMTLGGIFFLPNVNSFEISGNAGQTILLDAQFYVRKLDVTGGSTLKMVPNLANQVPIASSRVALIR